MKARHIFIPILLLVMAATAQAAPAKWDLDTAHSGIYFDAKHIFSIVRGHFDDYSATLNIDTDNIANSSCSVTVQTKSITTYNRKRDTHLRSAELFDTGKHPTMTFTSTNIIPKGGNRYIIEGNLTIRGITKKISAPSPSMGSNPTPSRRQRWCPVSPPSSPSTASTSRWATAHSSTWAS